MRLQQSFVLFVITKKYRNAAVKTRTNTSKTYNFRQTNMMAKNETVFAQHEIPILAPGKAITTDLWIPLHQFESS